MSSEVRVLFWQQSNTDVKHNNILADYCHGDSH